MPDVPNHDAASRASPPDWGAALARLPDEAPPRDAWQRLVVALDAKEAATPARASRTGRVPRPVGWLAMAATLALAVALPWRAMQPDVEGPAADPATSSTEAPRSGTAPIEALYLESAQLETLLAHARDDRVSTGTAAAVGAGLDARLAAIDAELARAGLAPARERALWETRVGVLRQLVQFEGTRRWLAVHGDAYDGALARVD